MKILDDETGRIVLTMDEAKALGLDIKTSDKAVREITEMENQRIAGYLALRDFPIGAVE